MKQKINYLLYAALGLALLAGCSDIMNPPHKIEQESQGGLRISVSSAAMEPRTLYPKTPIFTSYELEFSGPSSYNAVFLDSGTPYITLDDLPNGQWTITAKGYVMTSDGPKPAAQGTATRVVTAGSFQAVEIAIQALQGGERGIFSYSLSYPAIVSDAELYIYDVGAYYNSGDFYSLNSNQPGEIPLDSGYHMMSMVFFASGNQIITWTEVIYIAPNMVTEARRTFTEDDFARLSTIGGSANITVNENPANSAYVYVFRDENYYNYMTSWPVDISNNRWDITIPDLNVDTLYLRVDISDGLGGSYEKYLDPVTITGNATSYNINIAISTVQLSGTMTITVNGSAPNNVSIQAKRVDNNEPVSASMGCNPDFDGICNWTMNIESFDTPTEIYFMVGGGVEDGQDYLPINTTTGVTRTVSNRTIDNIDFTLALNIITVGGNVSVFGSPPQQASITIHRDNGEWVINNSVEVDPVTGNWETRLVSFAESTEITFNVWGSDYEWNGFDRRISRTLHDTDKTDIDFTIKRITVGGTVTINSVYNDMQWAYVQPNYPYWGDTAVYNGRWEIELVDFDTSTEVEFYVYGNSKEGFYFYKDFTREVFNTDKFDIDFDITIITITASGRVTVDDSPPDEARIDAETDEYWIDQVWIDSDGYWELTFLPFDTPVDIHFTVQGRTFDDSFDLYQTITRSLYQSDESGIDFAFTTIALSGTANITADGNPPDDNCWVSIMIDDEYGGETQTDGAGKWLIRLESSDTARKVAFSVWGNFEGARFSQFVTDEYASNQDISGITLTVASSGLVKLSGTISVPGNMVWFGIEAVTADGEWLGGNYAIENNAWAILTEPLAAATTVNFNLIGGRSVSGDYYDIGTVYLGSRTVSDVDVSGIDLSYNPIDVIILSGTVTVTVNGAPPHKAWVHGHDKDDNFVGGGEVGPDGYWEIYMWPFAALTDVYFEVWGFAFEDEQGPFSEWTENFQSVSNTNVSNINFTVTLP